MNGLTVASITNAITKHATAIFGAGAIVCVIGSVAEAIRATKKIERLGYDCNRMGKKDYLKAVLPSYIPTAILSVGAIACVIGGNVASARKIAGIAAACEISEKTIETYQNELKKLVGPEGEQEIANKLAKEAVSRTPIPPQIYQQLGDNPTAELWYDGGVTGQYFWCDKESIREAMNNVNFQLTQGDGFVPLNDFLDYINACPTNHGEEVGWTGEHLLNLTFGLTETPDGRPIHAIFYTVWQHW